MARFASFLFALAASVALSQPAAAGPIGNGPVVLLGYSGDENAAGDSQSLLLTAFGWRWRFDGADCVDDFLARGHIDFSWAVEPLVAAVLVDSSSFEASVVPYFRLAPLGWDHVVPYFEGGIGLAYTTLADYGLGSPVEFSDNAGIGVTFGSGRRWSIGYRFRHLSHAGLFDDKNDGLNVHFLALSVE